MSKIDKLRADRSAIVDQMRAINDLSEAEDRMLTVEETAEFDALDKNLRKLDAEIQRVSCLAEADARWDAPLPPIPSQPATAVADIAASAVDQLGIEPKPVPAAPIASGALKAYAGDARAAYDAGQFFLAVGGNAAAKTYCGNHPELQAALSEGSNSAGGFFVVPQFMAAKLIDLKEEYGVFRAHADVQPMASDTLQIPRRSSGVTAYPIGENTAVTASDMAWDLVELVARKWGVLKKISTELSEDAVVSMGDKVTQEIAWAFAKKEDECGFIGDGTSTYNGITGCINALAAGSIVTSAEQAFSAYILSEFESAVGKLPEYARANAKWYISRPGFAASMMRLLDALGGNTIGTVGSGAPLQFLGYPVVIAQSLSTTLTDQTSINQILFGDLAMAATLGTRRSMSVKVSTERYLEYDQIGILATTRYDINVHGVGDSSNPGPLIALQTAAS